MYETWHTAEKLKELQSLPLDQKIQITQAKVLEFYNKLNGNVFVSFSGGKDSTVLAHIVHSLLPDVPLVFVNTGLVYPEVQSFAKRMGSVFIYPKKSIRTVITETGYPIISKENAEAIYYARRIRMPNEEGIRTSLRKRDEFKEGGRHFSYRNYRRETLMGKVISQDERKTPSMFNKTKWLPAVYLPYRIGSKCCSIMKKSPGKRFQTKTKLYPIIASMAEESRLRKQAWLKTGCNSFEKTKVRSTPMAFWTEQDVLHYLSYYNIPYASPYGEIVRADGSVISVNDINDKHKLRCTGCHRTGCIFCLFGAHLERDDGRLLRLKQTHPKQYDYCMRGGEWIDNPDHISNAQKYDGDWENWNPKKIWIPSKEGLGMQLVIDEFNKLYPKSPICY
ncbi:MAG: phosphoadenosine phosphosulfate reductase family protein [Clostridia bacterium]|nr:phosphoadenosine phosphosulfate reductase family protein [Clostridia bacterium]